MYPSLVDIYKYVYVVLLTPDNRIILRRKMPDYIQQYRRNPWTIALCKRIETDKQVDALTRAESLLFTTYDIGVYNLENGLEKINIHIDSFSSYNIKTMILFIGKLNSKISLHMSSSFEIQAIPFSTLLNDVEKGSVVTRNYVFDTTDAVSALKNYYEEKYLTCQ